MKLKKKKYENLTDLSNSVYAVYIYFFPLTDLNIIF